MSAHGQGTWRHGEMEIKVTLNNAEEADAIHALNLNGDIYTRSGYALLYVTPEELSRVESLGFEPEILKPDLNAYSKNFWTNRDQYHSYEEIIEVIDSLASTYPSFCKKFSYGQSVEGRQLCALKISDNVNADEPEPEIMFDGGIHGDEIGGPENLVRFAEFLCDQYGNDPEITTLINSREIWLYIMVNPDGRVNMLRYNSNGVDLNRDWGYMWNGQGGSPEHYSQVETRALRTCAQSNQFVIHTTYHSGTVFLAYPWSYSPNPCPDQSPIQQLAGIYVDSSGYDYLPYEPGYIGMYEISGSSKDANYGIMGSISWTMEISTDKQPPVSLIGYYFDINKPSMIEMIEHAGYGISGTITDATLGAPVPATIFVDDYLPCYNDPVIGDYHKYILPGTYTVTAVANGYEPQTQTVIITESNTTVLDFELTQEYNQFAYRVVSCRIPTANFADEARTSAALWAPDGVSYSLGKSGWIILDMQDVILDVPGAEITVHEGDTEPEGYSCYAAAEIDGPWYFMGNGTGTANFDLGTSGLQEARFIRIEDDGDGPVNGENAGFDLDAAEVPEQQQIIYLTLDSYIDDQAGNGNQRIDPGENFNLIINLRNIGTLIMDNGQANLNIDNEFLTVNNAELNIEDLDYGESTQLVFSMNCSWFCPQLELLMTVLNITSNSGDFQESFLVSYTAGSIIEDWETIGFSQFDWSTGGNKPWAMSFTAPFEGVCSAKSGNIDDGQISSLQITMDVIGYDDISFYRKVSSEYGSDYLRFFVDNNPVHQWSGELGWEQVSYQVGPGFHTFKWTYEKDNAGSQGSDGGWIDYILFPSCNLDGTLKVLANAFPHEFCGSGESQLGAYILGGDPDCSFLWSPADPLDDPDIQFPVAFVDSSVEFSVEVTDGENSAASAVSVNSYPVPDTPVIIQEGDSLISQAEQGNQWYSVSGMIPGATEQVYYPPIEGDYFVIVTSEPGCSSAPSNIIHFIFTDIKEFSPDEDIVIYPNPFTNTFDIRFTDDPAKDKIIVINDLSGRVVHQQYILKSDYQDVIQILPGNIKKGIYLLKITDQDENLLVIKKMIKF